MKKRRCKECGKWFQPKSGKQVYCKDDHFRPCPNCGELVLVKPNCFNDPPRCCSKECMVELTKKRNLEKYGVEDPGNSAEALIKRAQTNLERYGCVDAGNRPEARAKREQTNLQRYGVKNAGGSLQASQKRAQTNMERYGTENAMQNSDIQERAKQSLLNKYGVDNPRHLADYDVKVKQTSLEKYGVDHYIAASSVREKSNATNLAKYGTIYPTQNMNVRSKIRRTNISKYGVPTALSLKSNLERARQRLEELYGVEFLGQSEFLRELAIQANLEKYGHPYPYSGQISQINRKVHDMLLQLNVDSEFEFHIEDKSYDLHILNTNILIEIDPTYTHNIVGNHWGKGVDKYYHKDKSELATKYGYRCIHIFDWDDLLLVLNTIVSSKTTIYARNCTISAVTKSDCDAFLNMHHLQGTVTKQIKMYGLYYKDELVEVMTFGAPRYNKHYEWELLRLCTSADTRVIGGASKLFKHFLEDVKPASIISYCDLAKFSGDVYEKLGMCFKHVSDPSIHWSNYSKQISDNLLRARGYDQLFNTSYGKGTSNEQLMLDHGWLPVYDCGQAVYVYESL